MIKTKDLKTCNNCKENPDCGSLSLVRFSSKKELVSFMKESSEKCKDWKEVNGSDGDI